MAHEIQEFHRAGTPQRVDRYPQRPGALDDGRFTLIGDEWDFE
ncbi:MAG: hypothetical protein R2873_15800 [Caldilineaceae bacterium]